MLLYGQRKGGFAIKQHSYFRYVLKLTTDQLESTHWDFHIDIHEAKMNGYVISLAESTCIRMIEDIVGVDTIATAARLRDISKRIRELRKQPKSRDQIRELRQLYQTQNELQFIPEYLCLVSTSKTAFKRACKGFSVNGMRYERLVGTTGGVKNSTVVFASVTGRNGAPVLSELRRRIDNGRDMTKEFVAAKLEAYRALVCSASTPLSAPRGVLVVDDCVTHFKSSYIFVEDGPGDEPVMRTVVDGDVELVDSDGCGMMSPELARRWGYDLHLDYLPAGLCLRNSFCKGMAFTFNFHEFADAVAGAYEVTDIWGQKHDIRDIELVLTASMLKLWDSYSSWDDYQQNCDKNGYCFSATKVTPKELDIERRLNYQFLQSIFMSDDDMRELVGPTLRELSDVMGGDYAKVLLFLRGTNLTEETAWSMDTPWVSALMASPDMLNDPFVRHQLKTLTKKKVRESKFGKLNVHGNFSVISGDMYALCESIWGMPVKGILKAGEIYNKYWAYSGAEEIAAFRAPMSSHHNIAKVRPQRSWSASHWYQYMDTVTVLNCHDMITHSLNGADKDGDLVFLTDNRVLVQNIRNVLPIQCGQKKAQKCIPGEPEFIAANILGFGDDIGSVTNRITAQQELQSLFEPGTPEYEELGYRIVVGEHIQQNCIDKMKGIISKPMPKRWYNENAAANSGDPIDEKICVSKKPYFMIYRYPELHSRHNAFQKTANMRALYECGAPLADILKTPAAFENGSEFRDWYYKYAPTQVSHGTINRICNMCEDYFAQINENDECDLFDPAILKTGVDYSRHTKSQIDALYRDYMARLQNIASCGCDDEEKVQRKIILAEEFRKECALVAPSEVELCDIVVDICYAKEKSKQFAWDMCGEQMVANVIRNSGGKIRWPRATTQGDIVYGGKRFKLETMDMLEADDDERYYYERSI